MLHAVVHDLRMACELKIRGRDAFGGHRQAQHVSKERHGLLEIGGAGQHPVDAFSDFHVRLCRIEAMSYKPSLLRTDCVHNAFDLLEVRPFMANQPLCETVQRPFERLARPCDCRRA